MGTMVAVVVVEMITVAARNGPGKKQQQAKQLSKWGGGRAVD